MNGTTGGGAGGPSSNRKNDSTNSNTSPFNTSKPSLGMNMSMGMNMGMGMSTNTNGIGIGPMGTMTRQSSNGSLNNGSGGGGGISFPKQSLSSNTFSFSPGASSGSGINGMGMGGAGTGMASTSVSTSMATPLTHGQQRKNPNAFDSNVGGIGIGNANFHTHTNGFINHHANASTPNNTKHGSNNFNNMNPFHSSTPTSIQTTTSTFQPNSVLGRPSPRSTSQNGSNDLASTVGLRRRAVGGSTSTSSGGKKFRPPLPVMTRLGVSTDAPDTLKENLMTHPNIDSTQLYNKTQQLPTPQSITPTTTKAVATPTSIVASFSATNYSPWVVIWGFTNALEYNKIIANFSSYGKVVDQYPPSSSTFSTNNNNNGIRTGSNWACVKYESSLQADKAICQNGSLVHITGVNSVSIDKSKSNNGTINSDSSGPMSSSSSSSPMPSSNFTVQDDIVIIGVMRVNEGIAMKLGLKNYIEIGSTGYEKRIGNRVIDSNGEVNVIAPAASSSYSPTNHNNVKQNPNMHFASAINNEDDILLLGDDNEGGRKKNGVDLYDEHNHTGTRGGVCDKILSWYFNW